MCAPYTIKQMTTPYVVPTSIWTFEKSLRWRHNERDGVSNHQPHDCLLNRLFRRRPKKTSKLRVTGLCVGNSPGTGEFSAQMASNAENVSIWWRHHVNLEKNSVKWFENYHMKANPSKFEAILFKCRKNEEVFDLDVGDECPLWNCWVFSLMTTLMSFNEHVSTYVWIRTADTCVTQNGVGVITLTS